MSRLVVEFVLRKESVANRESGGDWGTEKI